MHLTAVFQKVAEGYIGFVEELPGANTQAATLEEARANLTEAVDLVLEANRVLAEETILGKDVIREMMNIGDGFSTGPIEAAYVINELVKPASVIASHVNEVGTVGGKVRPGSKTEAFVKASKVPVIIPLSGKLMEFDGVGKCAAGC